VSSFLSGKVTPSAKPTRTSMNSHSEVWGWLQRTRMKQAEVEPGVCWRRGWIRLGVEFSMEVIRIEDEM